MELPLAKKRRENGKRKDRDTGRRSFARDEMDVDLMDESSAAAPVDTGLNPDSLSEAEWQHMPSLAHPLDAWAPPTSSSCSSSFPPSKLKDFGLEFPSSSPAPLPFSLSPSLPSSPATSPVHPSSHTSPRPRAPSPTFYCHYPTFNPLPTAPPHHIPTNTLKWDIDPARLEARRRRVAHLYRKFCGNGERDVGEMEKEMGYRGWIMDEWCALEHVRSVRMKIGG